MPNPTDLENAVSNCFTRLLELLQRSQNAGIEQIVEIMSSFPTGDNETLSTKKLQSRKMVMGRMLAKVLQAEDPVFKRVSRTIYLALRGVILGGSGPSHGCQLAEIALRQIGAGSLLKKAVEAGEVLVVAATVSVNVHVHWYRNSFDHM